MLRIPEINTCESFSWLINLNTFRNSRKSFLCVLYWAVGLECVLYNVVSLLWAIGSGSELGKAKRGNQQPTSRRSTKSKHNHPYVWKIWLLLLLLCVEVDVRRARWRGTIGKMTRCFLLIFRWTISLVEMEVHSVLVLNWNKMQNKQERSKEAQEPAIRRTASSGIGEKVFINASQKHSGITSK